LSSSLFFLVTFIQTKKTEVNLNYIYLYQLHHLFDTI